MQHRPYATTKNFLQCKGRTEPQQGDGEKVTNPLETNGNCERKRTGHTYEVVFLMEVKLAVLIWFMYAEIGNIGEEM